MDRGRWFRGRSKLTAKNQSTFRESQTLISPLVCTTIPEQKKTQVDKYEVDGDTPNIDTVFFMKIHNVKNVIVLISWHQLHQTESINGKTYQVYAYKYSNDSLFINDMITKDPALNGMDGEFNGDEVHFNYKNAASIKQYIKNEYN